MKERAKGFKRSLDYGRLLVPRLTGMCLQAILAK